MSIPNTKEVHPERWYADADVYDAGVREGLRLADVHYRQDMDIKNRVIADLRRQLAKLKDERRTRCLST